MENLEIFGFRALWSPYYLTCIVVAAAFYLLLVTKGKHRATVKEKTLFLTGLVLLYAVKGSPIDLMGHIMFSALFGHPAASYYRFTCGDLGADHSNTGYSADFPLVF